MAQPFVKIINSKLSLVGVIPQGNPRVVSILGKARMGKSTFLNSIVTHLENQSSAPFKAQDCDDHCTRGIDFYHLPEHNILLLDSQGLDYEDASHDPHLLLLLYILSDVIVFNDTRRLENGALKLMEPVCTFTNYLDIDTLIKPRLYFRIFDSDVKDAQKNLEKVLGSYPDQYQSIRNSIKHLFDKDIQLLKTEPLDRPSKIMLANKMYRELLAEPLGFREAILSILQAVITATPKSVLNDIPNIIKQINENQEISIEKLDVVKLQAENDIHKWIQTNVPALVYTDISVDGTQESYEEKVEPRKNLKKSILTSFTKRFKDVEETIRAPFKATISEKMDSYIVKAIDECKLKARQMITGPLAEVQQNRVFSRVNSLQNSFISIPEDFWKDYLSSFIHLESHIEHLYEPIKREISNWLCDIYDVVNTTLDNIRKEETKQAQIVQSMCDKEFSELEPWLLTKIKGCINLDTVIETNVNILTDILKERLILHRNIITKATPRHSVQFRLENKKMIASVETDSVTHSPDMYNLTKEIYMKFLQDVYTMIENPANPVIEELIQLKQQFLYNKLFTNRLTIPGQLDGIQRYVKHEWTEELLSSNPEIEFLEDTIAAKNLLMNPDCCIMTRATYENTFQQLYEGVLESLTEKRRCTSETAKKFIECKSNKICFYDNDTKYIIILQDIFKRKLQKAFCEYIVDEVELPTEYSSDICVKKKRIVEFSADLFETDVNKKESINYFKF